MRRGFCLFFLHLICLLLIKPLQANANTKINSNTLADSVEQLNKLCEEIRFSDPEKALQLALKAKSIVTPDDQAGQAATYLNLGSLYIDLAKYVEALDNLNSALKIFEELNNNKGQANTLYYISRVYLYQGNFPESLKLCLNALSIAETTNERSLIATITNAAGIIYHYQHEYEKARSYYEAAMTIREEIGDEQNMSRSLNSLATVFKDLGEYEKSVEYYFKALEIAKRFDNKLSIADYNANLGLVYSITKDYNKSIEHYLTAGSIFHSIGSADGEAFVHCGLAEVYNETKQYKLAKYHGFIGLRISLQAGWKENIVDVTYAIYNTYKHLNKIDSALYYFEMYSAYNDSVYNDDRNKAIAAIQTNYELEKKRREIEILKKDAQIKEDKAKLQRLQRNIAISGAAAFLVLLILLGNRMKLRKKLFLQKEEKLKAEARYREEEALRKEEELKATAEINKINAERIKEELEYRNREITTSALYMVQKNEMLSQIGDKLAKLKDSSLPENKKEITQLKRLIKNNIELDDDWNNFKLHFEKVHPKFFKNLTEKYPELTNNEQKICAYLRMNLSGKEIARLMNISPKSTQMSRYRLKKKFNLGADDDLFEFIKAF